jgi:type IV pilus biogenesis protein CpaD/CtpE
MERLHSPFARGALLAGTIGMAALLSGCGQTSPPTGEQVSNDVQYFELDDVVAANGEPVRCAMYGSQSENTNNSKSWFGFSCDFEGTAQFPDEAPQTTTTTIG